MRYIPMKRIMLMIICILIAAAMTSVAVIAAEDNVSRCLPEQESNNAVDLMQDGYGISALIVQLDNEAENDRDVHIESDTSETTKRDELPIVWGVTITICVIAGIIATVVAIVSSRRKNKDER